MKLKKLFVGNYFTERTKFFACGSMLTNLGSGLVKLIIAVMQFSFYFAFNGMYNIVLGSGK